MPETWKEHMARMQDKYGGLPNHLGNMAARAEAQEDRAFDNLRARFTRPTVRGEPVTIISRKPEGFTGLGHKNGDILVRYPDGEQGCVSEHEIREG